MKIIPPSVCLILLFIANSNFAQISYPGRIKGYGHDQNLRVQYITVTDAALLKKLTFETLGVPVHQKSDIFGSNVDVRISPNTHGSWVSLVDKCKIWRMGITSSNANSLQLIFDPFILGKGCKFLVYSPNMKQVLGAFSEKSNKESGIFAISPIYDDSLIVELQLSPGFNDFGSFQLSKIGVGFPNGDSSKNISDHWYGGSAACEVDVNCEPDKNIQLQKHSVVRIVCGGKKNIRCTGTLINNVQQDKKLYVLTAGHCINDSYDAYSAIFTFDYESPFCGGGDGSIQKSVSGSKLRAKKMGKDETGQDYLILDYALVELTEEIPLDYLPVFSGWDATGDLVYAPYILHHPWGDVKKISRNFNYVASGTSSPQDDDSHWFVDSYAFGTTEPGSSGAALFDTADRVTGILNNGGGPCDSLINDYYQKFSRCYADYPKRDEQLKYWLDPKGTGKLMVDNLVPFNPIVNRLEIMSNTTGPHTFELLENPSGWGYLTGQNSGYTREFAERYSMNGTKYIYGVNIEIAKVFGHSKDSRITLKIWYGVDIPKFLMYSQELNFFELEAGQNNYIQLDSAVYANNNFFIGYEVYYQYPYDTFALKTVAAGIKEGQNTAFVNQNGGWRPLSINGKDLNTSLAISPAVINYPPQKTGESRDYPFNDIIVYPNPSSGQIQILLREKPVGELTLNIYDLYGHLLKTDIFNSPEPNIYYSIDFLKLGIYLIQVKNSASNSSVKFVKY